MSDLAPPEGVYPVVSDDRALSIDLRAAVAED